MFVENSGMRYVLSMLGCEKVKIVMNLICIMFRDRENAGKQNIYSCTEVKDNGMTKIHIMSRYKAINVTNNNYRNAFDG